MALYVLSKYMFVQPRPSGDFIGKGDDAITVHAPNNGEAAVDASYKLHLLWAKLARAITAKIR
jgi:hypothetical protein